MRRHISEIIILIAVVITLALIAFLAERWMTEDPYPETPAPAEDEVSEDGVRTPITSDTSLEGTETYRIAFEYPVTGSAKVNAEIRALVEEQAREFKDIATYELPSGVTWKNELISQFDVIRASDHVVSFHYAVGSYTGGAHPNNYAVTQTFDLKTGAKLGLSDIFVGSDYLVRLADLSYADLNASIGTPENLLWLREGTAPSPENYQAFAVTPMGLTIYFSPYQVGPYALGEQRVEIGFEEVSDILSPSFMALIRE